MSGFDTGLLSHLKTGTTTTCRAWAVRRRDGVELGFTDHDLPLSFEGISFRADSGLSAGALQQSTGLSVDNSEALGALSHEAIREADIEAGRYDGAEIRAWLVNWADVTQRQMLFRGTIGELRRAGTGFEAELRGLTDLLNRPLGRVYQKPCGAVLGDAACGVDLDAPGYSTSLAVLEVEERRVFRFDALAGFAPGWFRHGRLEIESGAAAGLTGMIKRDISEPTRRVIELWHPIRAEIVTGDMLTLRAGCDKRMATCRETFNNLINFQGFPDIPGDDWSLTDPSKSGDLSGGSRR